MDGFFIFVSGCAVDGRMECGLYRLGEVDAKVAEVWIGDMMDEKGGKEEEKSVRLDSGSPYL